MAAILGDLSAGLQHWVGTLRAGIEEDAVHQARVATRRLRSALTIFRPVCPALAPLAEDVKHCAGMLGAVRDWDVFLSGTGATAAKLAGEDARIGLLLRAATRRRATAEAALRAFLAGPAFDAVERGIGAAIETDAAPDDTHGTVAPFAADVLSRRFKRVRRRGRSLAGLPVEALHELRKDAKRLRYAADFFAPAFPGRAIKPFIRRVAELQADLGTLNDAAASAALMAQLGRAGRGYAAGLAEGLALAEARPALARIGKSWKQFRKAKPFWE